MRQVNAVNGSQMAVKFGAAYCRQIWDSAVGKVEVFMLIVLRTFSYNQNRLKRPAHQHVVVFLKHSLRRERFPGVGCTCNHDDHTFALSSRLTFSKSLQVNSGMRALISSILLSHHLNLSMRSISSSSKRFRKTLTGFPTTLV